MTKFKRLRIDSPENILVYLNFLQYELREKLYLITVNARLEIIDCHHLKSGGANIDLIHPREVILPALTDKAKGIILVHNHPSGQSHPSSNDNTFTKYIKKICDLLNIALIDHLIISKNEVYSYKKSGAEIFSHTQFPTDNKICKAHSI